MNCHEFSWIVPSQVFSEHLILTDLTGGDFLGPNFFFFSEPLEGDLFQPYRWSAATARAGLRQWSQGIHGGSGASKFNHGFVESEVEWLSLVGWMVDWLVGWLVGWLLEWLVGWLVGWLIKYVQSKLSVLEAQFPDNIFCQDTAPLLSPRIGRALGSHLLVSPPGASRRSGQHSTGKIKWWNKN